MGEYAKRSIKEAKNYLQTSEQEHAEIALQIEGDLNNLDREITKYLVGISSATLTEPQSRKHTALMDSVRDIERIGDHFENIIELITFKKDKRVSLTDTAQLELNEMFDLVLETVDQAIKSLEEMSSEQAMMVRSEERRVGKECRCR